MAKYCLLTRQRACLCHKTVFFQKTFIALAINPPKEVLPAVFIWFWTLCMLTPGSVLQTCAVCSYLSLGAMLTVLIILVPSSIVGPSG